MENKVITDFKKYLNTELLLEHGIISNKNEPITAWVRPGTVDGVGRNEHCPPHFHIFGGKLKDEYKIMIPLLNEKDLTVDNINDYREYIELTTSEKKIIGKWLVARNIDNAKAKRYVSNLYAIAYEWHTLNKDLNCNNVIELDKYNLIYKLCRF